ncbi:hypothetical protein EH228_07305 [Erwinia endophytica]|uniref:hypothetical protein n=1 Tax=Erwinia endophytica TaxID=1563158 RepID=UPI0012660598|nr:hypothetical protein [Erwinia endophytica]KAB8312327.1 hypothetical protein EH228_07305 [Erwinia endophytica]
MKTGLHPVVIALLLGAMVTLSHHPGTVKVAGRGDTAPMNQDVRNPVSVQQVRWRWPLAGPAGGGRLPGTEQDEDLSIQDTTEDSPRVAKALTGQVFQGPSYRF